nr:hypothetical protein [Tanacetum cinerariifolium]
MPHFLCEIRMPVAAEDANLQKALEESMKSIYDVPLGPLPPVVIRKPESGKYQPLPEVPGKGKAKVTEEQVAHDLLSLQKPKKKSSMDQYIFQRHTSTPTGSSGHDEPSYAELGQSESEESEKVVSGADEGGQREGQARPDPSQAGPDPGNAGADVQSIPSPVVHAGSDREHMDLDVQENLKLTVEDQVLLEEPASSSGTLSSLQHLSKDISFGDLFFSDKPLDVDIDKENAETKVKSMVSVTIQQDMSSIPPMTSPIIDLTSRPESPKVHQQFKATTTKTTTTTTTTTLPPPPAQQQSTAKAMMMKRIGELKHIMANLIQENRGLEERLDSHGSYLAEARKKKKKSRESPKTPSGSPPHQPPPPPPSAGPSKASGALGAFGSSQVPPPPPPPSSTNQESQSKGSATPSSSKTAASVEYQAWMMTNIRLRSSISLTPADLEMDKDVGPDEQAQSSDDEDIESTHIPKVNLRQDWWKTFKEERHATPEPAWSILSSDVPVPTNNWASALASNYSPPPEDSLLAQTSDIATFMDWTHMLILSVVRIKVFSMYGYDYMKNIVLRRADLNEHVIVERDFKYLYPSDFEDLYLLNLQGHLNHLPPKDKKILTTAVNQWTRLSDSEFKYEVLDQEGCGSEQGVHVRHTEAVEDKEDLSQSGEICWWTRQRWRLQTLEVYQIITSFWHSRFISDDL